MTPELNLKFCRSPWPRRRHCRCQWAAARGKTGPYSAILLVAQACDKDSESLRVSVFSFAFKFTATSSL